MDDLLRRALAAYFKSGGQDQPAGDSGVKSVDGLDYVRLKNVGGTLAVFRVDTVGRLKRLKRYPKALDE
jgi:hypothetical protein